VGFREFFDPPQLQLLYGLLPEYCGRGLATEVAARICRHAFRELGFTEIAAATDVPNQASVKVLRRLGMREVRRSDDGTAGTVFFVLNGENCLPQGNSSESYNRTAAEIEPNRKKDNVVYRDR
jgi:ribosomal-protein-alanine N-acetyltransferase